MRDSFRKYSLVTCLAMSSVACGSDAGSDASEDPGTSKETVAVEVFSWWTAPGEAEALDSLMVLHKDRFPNTRIFNAATDPAIVSGGSEAKQLLQDRMESGDPPDSFQTNAYELHQGYLAADSDLLHPLDDLFDDSGLSKDIFPELLEGVMVDGHLRAVPVNVHRENSLFYNVTVFKENGVEPPQTMAEFLDVCETLKANGVTPLAISTSQAWIINKVFVALSLGSMGPDKFVKYFVDKEPVAAEDMAPAIDVLDKVLIDYIDVKAAATDGYGWTQAADSLHAGRAHAGRAAMFIHGDWAKGYLTHLGWTPGVDFGVTATPDSGGAFLWGSDVFAVPAKAAHLNEGLDWLRTIASEEGQVAFNAAKGSSPIRLGISLDGLDSMAAATYEDLKNSELRLSAVGLPQTWDDGLAQLAKDHDKQALLQIFIDNPIP
jgi:glucose/mannose transport system substrate-binding protein